MRAILVLVTLLLAGCASPGASSPEPDEPALAWPRCADPWPCGDGSEWPADLAGPFLRMAPERVKVESFDGTVLDGAVWRPELPDGVRAPVILFATPYVGQCSFQSVARGEPDCDDRPDAEERMEGSNGFGTMVEAGYAVAIFNVRGTGLSGGCYDLWGPREQQDMEVLVNWAAAQPWSNGRVAMNGLSYSGTTPWEAAIRAPPALKAIVVAGIITDVYTGSFDPQGAGGFASPAFMPGTVAFNSLVPAVGERFDRPDEWTAVAPERVCEETKKALDNYVAGPYAAERDAQWFGERRLIDHFGNVSAAVLVVHGLHDNQFHRFQEDVVWQHLDSPKAMVLGQWPHTIRLDDFLQDFGGPRSWPDLNLAWLDFWLKGLGDPPALLSQVQYEDSTQTWRNSTAWPPAEARAEALWLDGASLAPAAGSTDRSVRLAPGPKDECDGAATGGTVAYATEPLAERVVLAGNPFALLRVTADRPEGVFLVRLATLTGDPACGEGGVATLISEGSVDLRYHDGAMTARGFPVGTPTLVRVDLYNVATAVEKSQRLVLLVSNPGESRHAKHDATTLTLHADASHVVLPVVEGTLGGADPLLVYPPRPFAPVRP